MKISIIIPAHNEQDCHMASVSGLSAALVREKIPHEILIVNDNSTDRTAETCAALAQKFETVRYVNNSPPNGFGFAVRLGLNCFQGEAVAVVMADRSDDPEDLVAANRKLEQGFDCVFGSRFINGSKVVDYPAHKLMLNRLANWFICVIFGIRYNDLTPILPVATEPQSKSSKNDRFRDRG